MRNVIGVLVALIVLMGAQAALATCPVCQGQNHPPQAASTMGVQADNAKSAYTTAKLHTIYTHRANAMTQYWVAVDQYNHIIEVDLVDPFDDEVLDGDTDFALADTVKFPAGEARLEDADDRATCGDDDLTDGNTQFYYGTQDGYNYAYHLYIAAKEDFQAATSMLPECESNYDQAKDLYIYAYWHYYAADPCYQ